MSGTELGTMPVRDNAPAGEDIRDQEDFLALQAEVNRGQSVSSGESAVVDWAKVRVMAETILRERSKDLLVAAYFSAAAARIGGPSGVTEGVSLMKGLVGEFWETLYPPVGRLRARRNALSWWMDRMQEILPSLEGPPLDPETKEQCVRNLRELNAILGERDPEAPTLAPLFGLVEALPTSLPPEPSRTDEPAPLPPASPSTSAPPGPGGVTVEMEGDPFEVLERIGPALRDLADRISETAPGDARSIFLSRMILWEGIRDLPESEGGATRIPAPPSHLLSALDSLTASGTPEDLLRFLILRQEEFPFWLELSYRAGRILEDTGPAGAGGAEAFRGSLRVLLSRLPGLASLSFSGGELPFLSGEGQAWVFPEKNVQEGGGTGGEERKRSPVLPASVREALADGRIGEASERFEEVRRKELSPRGRFLLNLEFLSAVGRMGRDFPVLSLALVLLEDLERFRLDLWEPAVASRALPLVCEILSQSGDEACRRRAETLAGRLASFDLPGALRVFTGGR